VGVETSVKPHPLIVFGVLLVVIPVVLWGIPAVITFTHPEPVSPAPYPTYPPYPTYTPYPTFTPVPTPQPTTPWLCMDGAVRVITMNQVGELQMNIVGEQVICAREWKWSNIYGPSLGAFEGPIQFKDLRPEMEEAD